MMEKRASIRAYYDNKAEKALEDKRYAERTAQLDAFQSSLVNGVNSLLRFMDGKVTKTEIVNQLKEYATSSDISKIASKLDKLDSSVLGSKVDQKPLLDALNSLKREVTVLPQKMPKPLEQRKSVEVSNLKEIVFNTKELEKAINSLDLKVEAPIINTEKVDLKPLKDVMLDVLKAVGKFKVEIPKEIKVSNLDDIKPTDTKEIEKKLAEANKLLKAISEKRTGGGGGGGNGTPYTDSTGKPMNVILTASGQIPVDVDMATEGIATEATLAKLVANEFVTVDTTSTTDVMYIGTAPIASSKAAAVWKLAKLDLSGKIELTWADGNANYDNIWNDRVTKSYS